MDLRGQFFNAISEVGRERLRARVLGSREHFHRARVRGVSATVTQKLYGYYKNYISPRWSRVRAFGTGSESRRRLDSFFTVEKQSLVKYSVWYWEGWAIWISCEFHHIWIESIWRNFFNFFGEIKMSIFKRIFLCFKHFLCIIECNIFLYGQHIHFMWQLCVTTMNYKGNIKTAV